MAGVGGTEADPPHLLGPVGTGRFGFVGRGDGGGGVAGQGAVELGDGGQAGEVGDLSSWWVGA